MDPEALDLSQRSARAAIPYAAGLAVVFAVMGLIPCLGGCVNYLLSLAGFFAVAYLITPKLSNFPPGQSKAMLALSIGLGVAVTVTAGFVLASLIDSVLRQALGSIFDYSGNVFGNAVGGLFAIILGLIAATFYGLIVGTLLSFLGSYLSLDRNRSVEEVARPF